MRRAIVALLMAAGGSAGSQDRPKAQAFADRALQAHLRADSLTAVALYDSAVRSDATWALAFHRRGMLRYSLGIPGGTADIERALALDSTSSATWFVRGRIRVREGDTALGVVDLRRATAMGNRGAARLLAAVERRLGAPAAAPSASPTAAPDAHVSSPPQSQPYDNELFVAYAIVGIITFSILAFTLFVAGRVRRAWRDEEFIPLRAEKELWTGTPEPGMRFGTMDILPIFFGLFAFGAGWVAVQTARTDGMPMLFEVFGNGLMLLGIYLVALRYVIKTRRLARTVYTVTTERVILSEGDRMRWISLRGASPQLAEEFADSSGTLHVYSSAVIEATSIREGLRIGSEGLITMEHIPDVAGVYRLVQEQRKVVEGAIA